MKYIFIYKQNTIFETLEKLQKVGSQCLVVVNKNNLLLGTISDNKHCYKIKKTDTSIKEFSSKMKNYTSELNSLHVIPIVDKKNKVVDLIHQDIGNNMSSHLLKNLEVVIMAGGLGTRLRPYTNILPKPLIPYNDKTIIENIKENILKFNLKNFYISINYKNYLIS